MDCWGKKVGLSEMAGLTIKEIRGLEKDSEAVTIITECGKEFLFYHDQDGRESVFLEDFDGDSEELAGALIIGAEEVKDGEQFKKSSHEGGESFTWTFYKIETNKGGVWMRWLGQSNGYYSEGVDFVWANKPDLNH